MKIGELRDLLKTADKKQLLGIIDIVYKSLPKDRKEDIDTGITDLLSQGKDSSKKAAKPVKPKKTLPDMAALRDQISAFVDNAREGLYLRPNRTVSKERRSKWRFEAQRFVKDLKQFSPADEDYQTSLDCLKDIYQVLTEGCGVYLFRSDDPFASIGINQEEFYAMLCDRVFLPEVKPDRETLADMIDLATNVSIDRTSLHTSLILSYLDHMRDDADILRLSAEIVSDLLQELPPDEGPSFFITIEKCLASDRLENLCEMLQGLYTRLGESEKGARLFFEESVKHRTHSGRKEVIFYCMLQNEHCFGGNDRIWTELYEEFRDKEKIDPRESLVKLYNEKMAALED
ncbi:hypothetical protein [Succinimonas sp.]|uniref:hypothetical protein n=1 Tax=Succinimonas sp. TaxID=1936151 RepID=UPI0038682866